MDELCVFDVICVTIGRESNGKCSHSGEQAASEMVEQCRIVLQVLHESFEMTDFRQLTAWTASHTL